jgi:hypothetical protein
MATTSATARPKSALSKAEPTTVPPKNDVELAADEFNLDRLEVERLSYGFWLERQHSGDGSPEEDWFRAENVLRARTISNEKAGEQQRP